MERITRPGNILYYRINAPVDEVTEVVTVSYCLNGQWKGNVTYSSSASAVIDILKRKIITGPQC